MPSALLQVAAVMPEMATRKAAAAQRKAPTTTRAVVARGGVGGERVAGGLDERAAEGEGAQRRSHLRVQAGSSTSSAFSTAASGGGLLQGDPASGGERLQRDLASGGGLLQGIRRATAGVYRGIRKKRRNGSMEVTPML
ncbi:unnamed protein product [Urochloa humidicola]